MVNPAEGIGMEDYRAVRPPVVRVKNLALSYETRKGDINAVRGVSFEIKRGEALGLVGESGCGKSTIAYGLVGYMGKNGKVVGGDIEFQGKSLINRTPEELRNLRGAQVSMVFQDPMTSLNPVLRIGDQMTEVLTAHRQMDKTEAVDQCLASNAELSAPDFGRAAAAHRDRHGDAQQPGSVDHG